MCKQKKFYPVRFILGGLMGSHSGHVLIRRRPRTPTMQIYCIDCGAILYERDVM